MSDGKQKPSYGSKAEYYRKRKDLKKREKRSQSDEKAVDSKGRNSRLAASEKADGKNSGSGKDKLTTGAGKSKVDTGKKSTVYRLRNAIKRPLTSFSRKVTMAEDDKETGFLTRRASKAVTFIMVMGLLLLVPCMAVMGFVSLFETPLSITLPSMEDENVNGVTPILEEASGLYRDFYIDLSEKMEKFDEVEYIGDDNLEWLVKVYDLRVPEGENACDMEDPAHKNLLKMTFDQMVLCETTYGYKEVSASEVEGYTGYWYYSEYDEEGNPTKAMVQYCRYRITYLTAEEWRQKHQWATIQEEFWDEIMAYDIGDLSEYQQTSRPGSIANYRAIGGETQLDIYHFLLDSGMSAAGACGVMGNLMTESGFNPNAVSSSGTFHGIAQWGHGRWTACVNGGYSGSLEGQLNYLVMEMSTEYGGVWDYVCYTGDPIEAANRVAAYYEICPGTAGNAAEYNGIMYQGLADRRGYARAFYETFGMSGA